MTITWKVEKMECLKGGCGVDNLVQKVWYKVLGEEIVDGETYTGRTEGFVSITPVGPEFSNFEDLFEEVIIQWCWDNGISRAAAEAEVTRQIEEKKAAVKVIIENPWP